MTVQNISKEIFAVLSELPPEQQYKVLAFAYSLKSQVKGVKGASLLAFSGDITPDDLSRMERVIEEGCERVDLDNW